VRLYRVAQTSPDAASASLNVGCQVNCASPNMGRLCKGGVVVCVYIRMAQITVYYEYGIFMIVRVCRWSWFLWFKLQAILLMWYREYLLSLSKAPQLAWDVAADVLFLCDKPALLWPTLHDNILVYKSQQNAHVTEFILSDNYSTWFGRHYHPSSGAQNNCNYSIW